MTVQHFVRLSQMGRCLSANSAQSKKKSIIQEEKTPAVAAASLDAELRVNSRAGWV
ncbi:hypothetical protein PAMP_016954 [Pampus punctatissimus]